MFYTPAQTFLLPRCWLLLLFCSSPFIRINSGPSLPATFTYYILQTRNKRARGGLPHWKVSRVLNGWRAGVEGGVFFANGMNESSIRVRTYKVFLSYSFHPNMLFLFISLHTPRGNGYLPSIIRRISSFELTESLVRNEDLQQWDRKWSTPIRMPSVWIKHEPSIHRRIVSSSSSSWLSSSVWIPLDSLSHYYISSIIHMEDDKAKNSVDMCLGRGTRNI